LTPAKYVKRVLVLRLSPDELRERLTSLGWKKEKIKENVGAEILDSCLISALEAFKTSLVEELDVTDHPKRRVNELVQKILQGELISPLGQVTWLKQLETAGRLEEFL
jgi:adenylate kinase